MVKVVGIWGRREDVEGHEEDVQTWPQHKNGHNVVILYKYNYVIIPYGVVLHVLRDDGG